MNKVQIVIPMAGKGERFKIAGYQTAKPFIEINGRCMIEHVLANLYIEGAEFLLLVRAEHLSEYDSVFGRIRKTFPIKTVAVGKETEGALCTVLLARPLFSDVPIIVANSDQLVDFSLHEFIMDALRRKLGGSILVFQEPTGNPKWSYALTGPDGMVNLVREKEAISAYATVGIYYFKQPKILLDAAVDLLANNDRTNNEFYLCPVYNYVVGNGVTVGVFEVASGAMHGLGTPEDLAKFLEFNASEQH